MDTDRFSDRPKAPAFLVESWKPVGPDGGVVMLVVRRANSNRTATRRSEGEIPSDLPVHDTINVARLSGPMVDVRAMRLDGIRVGTQAVPGMLGEMFTDWLLEHSGPKFPAPETMHAHNQAFSSALQQYARCYADAERALAAFQPSAPATQVNEILCKDNRLWKSVCKIGGQPEACLAEIIAEAQDAGRHEHTALRYRHDESSSQEIGGPGL